MKKIPTKPCTATTIKTVAERLFAAHGYEGASTRQIADEAAVNISAITYYFESKEGLYRSIFKTQLTELHDMIQRISNLDEDAAGKLNQFLDLYIGRLKNEQNFHRLLQREISSQIHSALKEGILSQLMNNSAILIRIIEEGIDSGIFKKVDSSLFALTVLNTLYHVVGQSPFAFSLLQDNENLAADKVSDWIKSYLFGIINM